MVLSALKPKGSWLRQLSEVDVSFVLELSGTPQPISTYLMLVTPKLVLPAWV